MYACGSIRIWTHVWIANHSTGVQSMSFIYYTHNRYTLLVYFNGIHFIVWLRWEEKKKYTEHMYGTRYSTVDMCIKMRTSNRYSINAHKHARTHDCTYKHTFNSHGVNDQAPKMSKEMAASKEKRWRDENGASRIGWAATSKRNRRRRRKKYASTDQRLRNSKTKTKHCEYFNVRVRACVCIVTGVRQLVLYAFVIL